MVLIFASSKIYPAEDFHREKMSFRGLCSIWIKSKTFVIYIIPSVTYDKNDTQKKHFLAEFLQLINSLLYSTDIVIKIKNLVQTTPSKQLDGLS